MLISVAADPTSEITRILSDDKLSAAERANRLLPLVYDQLRAMASKHMASEGAGHTLQATALVHGECCSQKASTVESGKRYGGAVHVPETFNLKTA